MAVLLEDMQQVSIYSTHCLFDNATSLIAATLIHEALSKLDTAVSDKFLAPLAWQTDGIVDTEEAGKALAARPQLIVVPAKPQTSASSGPVQKSSTRKGAVQILQAKKVQQGALVQMVPAE